MDALTIFINLKSFYVRGLYLEIETSSLCRTSEYAKALTLLPKDHIKNYHIRDITGKGSRLQDQQGSLP